MSEYAYDGDRRYRSRRDPREGEYVEQSYYAPRQTELVRRPREDSDLSIEEIPREFPPGDEYYYKSQVRDTYAPAPRRARSLERGRRGYYEDDYYGGDPRRRENRERPARRQSLSKAQEIAAAGAGAAAAIGASELWERRKSGKSGSRSRSRNKLATAAIGVAGAAAGDFIAKEYVRRKSKSRSRVAEKKGSRDDYYADGESDYEEQRPRRPERRKSFSEKALEAVGLGGAGVAALSGRSKSRSGRDKSRRSSYDSRYDSRSRSRGRGGGGDDKMMQTIKAAALAAGVEAFRSRKDPGGWTGEKGRRILTAAIGAGGVDGLVDRDSGKHSKRHLAEAVIGGLAANRLANGPRDRSGSRSRSMSRSRSRGGRSLSRGGRSQSRGGRSQSRGGLKDLAAGGALAAAGKAIYDRVSRSRSRPRRRSYSRSDGSSISPPPRDRRRRGSSVSRYVTKGLTMVGLGEGAKDEVRRDRAYVDEDVGYSQPRAMPPDGGYPINGGYPDDPYYSQSRAMPPDAVYARSEAYSRPGSRNDYYDSEDDRPQPKPRERRADGPKSGQEKHEDRERNRSANGSAKDENKKDKKNSSSSSDDLSSSEEEKRRKKMRGKELVTAGLATVASIHAGHSVYKSVKARDKRLQEVYEGKMTPQEARKKKSKALLQDAASVGLAVLGIKGAVSEWKEAKEQRDECHEFDKERQEHHKKRMEKMKKQQEQQKKDHGDHNGDRNGNRRLTNDSYRNSAPDLSYGSAPVYQDGNPYASGGLPPPPVGVPPPAVGYDDRRYY